MPKLVIDNIEQVGTWHKVTASTKNNAGVIIATTTINVSHEWTTREIKAAIVTALKVDFQAKVNLSKLQQATNLLNNTEIEI